MSKTRNPISGPVIFYAVSGVLLTAGILYIYWPILVHLITQLADDEDFSYGLLLPLVSAYLVYLKWPELRQTAWKPNWVGLGVMLVGLSLYGIGKLAVHYYSLRLSFLIWVAGILLLLGGWRIVILLAFPLFLLVLMLPLPSIITSTVTLPLQLISSRLAAEFLWIMGYPLVLQGNVIDLGVRQLQVVAACSGLRYILSLLALGCIYCYFYQRQWWKVVILLVSLIPAAILANALRVAGMAIWPALQEGFWHSFSGWLIFVVCFVILGLLNWLLNILSPPPAVHLAEKTRESGEASSHSVRPQLVAACLVVVLGVFLAVKISSPVKLPLVQSFDHFPLQIGDWQGKRAYMSQEIFQKTDADSYIDVEYSLSQQAPVSLYVAHYESLSTPGGLAHNPAICMTGGGWKTIRSGIREIAPGQPVNYLVLEKAGVKLMVYWWNIHQGQWMALESGYIYKLHSMINALKLGRTDWALVRLITPMQDDPEAASSRLNAFARLLIPVLPDFIKMEAPGRPQKKDG